jgi:NAD(P)-dependent dehydrogenase (short-subunit alcohol dehydrogenase family)
MTALVVGPITELTDAIAGLLGPDTARAALSDPPRAGAADVVVIDLSEDADSGSLDQLAAATAWCEAAGAALCERRDGVIVVVGTTDAYHSQAGGAMRSTVQGGAFGMVRGYGIEWAPFGVRVVGVAYSRVRGKAERVPPIGRHPTTAEVAQTVEFMAGPDASYVVAETIRVDGGYVPYQMF